MLKNIRFAIIASASALMMSALVACGTKGPLYIPEQRYPQEPLPQTETNPQPADEAINAAPETNSSKASSPAQ